MEIKQLLAPPVPMWAEFADPDGAHHLTGAKTRGNAQPVVCLALVVESPTPYSLSDGIEAMCMCEGDACDPIFPASSRANFCGLSLTPPILITESTKSE